MSQPFLPESAHTSSQTPATLSTQSGLPASAFEAHRAGQPHWTLKDNLLAFSRFMRLDHQKLQAEVNRAEQVIVKAQLFPSAGRGGYRGLKS